MVIYTFTSQDALLLETIKNQEIETLKLAKKLGLSPQNTIKRVDKLLKYGLVEKTKEGRNRLIKETLKGNIALGNIPSILQIGKDIALKEVVDWRLEVKSK
jgi:DNA-binding MarR family transcriptional regulator